MITAMGISANSSNCKLTTLAYHRRILFTDFFSQSRKFAAARLSWPDPTAAPLPADRTAGNCAVSSPGPGTHSPIPHQIHKYKED